MVHKLSAFTITTMAVLATGACQSDELDEQQELFALLRDAPLTHVPGVAAASATGAAAAADDIRNHIILPTAAPIGAWDFEDCTPERTGLFDGSFNNNTAFRAVAVACTTGLQGGQALAIANPEDIVYVPDQPSFTFDGGVTVAGWCGLSPYAVPLLGGRSTTCCSRPTRSRPTRSSPSPASRRTRPWW